MKSIIFIVMAFGSLIAAHLSGGYAIQTVIGIIYPAWFVFGAIIGAMVGLYLMEVNNAKWWKKQCKNDSKNWQSVYDNQYKQWNDYNTELLNLSQQQLRDYNECCQERDNIKEQNNSLIGKLKIAEFELSQIYNHCKYLNHVILLLRTFTKNMNFIQFTADQYNNGATMSQNALADKLGMSRAKVRRTANQINKLLGYEYIKWGKAKVKSVKVKDVKIKIFLSNNYKGLNIPKNKYANKIIEDGGCAFSTVPIRDTCYGDCCNCLYCSDNNAIAKEWLATQGKEVK